MNAVEPSQTPAAPHCIAGVGASAGGIDALQAFCGGLPAHLPVAFVVIQHLPSDRLSELPGLLQKWCALPVRPAADGVAPEPGCIYVPLPGRHLVLQNGLFHTEPRDREHLRAGIDTIDAFFHSLAEELGPRAIAVVLSGTGADGASGAAEIKQAGGLVLVQDPTTASYADMPNATIAMGSADRVVPPERLGAEIASRASMGPPVAPVDSTRNLAQLLDDIIPLIRERGGLDLKGYKTTPLLWRLHQRMQRLGIADPSEYEALLNSHPAELETLVRGIPIHVTEFFRDPQAWEALAQEVIAPLFRDASSSQPIRVWTSACATGEEAYSLAILLAEQAQATGSMREFQVFASDVSMDIVARASRGRFLPRAIGGLSAARLAKFFERTEEGYRVKQELRSRMIFAPQHLLTDPPFGAMDVVTCRNLLIYLDSEAAQRLLRMLHSALREGGCLFLGIGEALLSNQAGFEPIATRWRIYRKSAESAAAGIADYPTRVLKLNSAQGASLASQMAHRALVEHLALPSVLIDAQHRILRVYGDTRGLLSLPAGEPTHDLMAVAAPSLVPSLRAAVKNALADQAQIDVGGALDDGAPISLGIRVTPLTPESEGAPVRLLVSFVPGSPGATAPVGAPSADPRLQASVEELEASHEELRALTEELKSANDQLNLAYQDLHEANAQLRMKVEELQTQSSVLFSGAVMTLFLDRELRVRWFTPAVDRVFPLRPGDVGRHITDLLPRFDDAGFLPDIQTVIVTGDPRDRELRTRDGSCYLSRIRPYHVGVETTGVAVNFTDITERRLAEDKLRESEARLASDLAGMHRLYQLHARLARETDLQAALQEILSAAVDFAHTDRGTIQLVHEETGKLEIIADRGYPHGARFIEHFRHRGFEQSGDAATRDKTRLIVEDTRTFAGFAAGVDREVALAGGILAAQSTPLITRTGESVGLLSTQYDRPYRPTEEELQLIDLLAWTATDFVERHRAYEALRMSEERLRHMLNIPGVCILIFEIASGTLVEANDAFFATFGYSREQVKSRSLTRRTLTPAEYVEISEAQMANLESTGRIGPYEKEYLRKDGTRSWMVCAGAGLGDGKAVEFCIDVSDRKQVEAALRQTELRLTQLLEASRRTGS